MTYMRQKDTTERERPNLKKNEGMEEIMGDVKKDTTRETRVGRRGCRKGIMGIQADGVKSWHITKWSAAIQVVHHVFT
jgi:hypothetical protein